MLPSLSVSNLWKALEYLLIWSEVRPWSWSMLMLALVSLLSCLSGFCSVVVCCSLITHPEQEEARVAAGGRRGKGESR